MTEYIIRAAMHDEANEGWIWIEGFPSRSLVEISNKENGRSVVCLARELDQNFLNIYNPTDKEVSGENRSHRFSIELQQDTVVMSSWYRDALGGFDTTKGDNANGKVALDVQRYRGWQPWGQLRAASHHPDIVARLGVRLGAIGMWLGLISIWLGLLSIIPAGGCARLVVGIIVVVLVITVGVALIAGCRGANTSPGERHA